MEADLTPAGVQKPRDQRVAPVVAADVLAAAVPAGVGVLVAAGVRINLEVVDLVFAREVLDVGLGLRALGDRAAGAVEAGGKRAVTDNSAS